VQVIAEKEILIAVTSLVVHCCAINTQQKTDQIRAEDPVEKIHACSTTSSAKRKQFILQFSSDTLV